MKFEVSDEELISYLTNHYDGDYGRAARENIDEFRDLFEQQIDGQDGMFYEIFEYCIHEALENFHKVDKEFFS